MQRRGVFGAFVLSGALVLGAPCSAALAVGSQPTTSEEPSPSSSSSAAGSVSSPPSSGDSTWQLQSAESPTPADVDPSPQDSAPLGAPTTSPTPVDSPSVASSEMSTPSTTSATTSDTATATTTDPTQPEAGSFSLMMAASEASPDDLTLIVPDQQGVPSLVVKFEGDTAGPAKMSLFNAGQSYYVSANAVVEADQVITNTCTYRDGTVVPGPWNEVRASDYLGSGVRTIEWGCPTTANFSDGTNSPAGAPLKSGLLATSTLKAVLASEVVPDDPDPTPTPTDPSTGGGGGTTPVPVGSSLTEAQLGAALAPLGASLDSIGFGLCVLCFVGGLVVVGQLRTRNRGF